MRTWTVLVVVNEARTDENIDTLEQHLPGWLDRVLGDSNGENLMFTLDVVSATPGYAGLTAEMIVKEHVNMEVTALEITTLGDWLGRADEDI